MTADKPPFRAGDVVTYLVAGDPVLGRPMAVGIQFARTRKSWRWWRRQPSIPVVEGSGW
ncbi:hypothetical protein KIH74_27950 [Kineosporia sp. J2-2]|uniref:Uncharacterized protein n=1 Tax=Kineosporia corallincola TaxID=2835133 RepID=A0ABS5TPQ6_9ACTN|nr:hypothetical protein [Kineosporia corallincola]MBT0772808.1 hypothetical protein [Kineosporia corallincola]